MKKNKHLKLTPLSLLIALIWPPSNILAAQIPLVQYPAGTAYKAPIPNVILSIDTSGSMLTYDDGANTRIQQVQKGLRNVLINSTKYDNQFRIAWQSFACNSIPSNSGGCSNNNTMAKFTGSQKTNFSNWINQLSASGTTPSQVLVWNAGKYLQTTGANSPWNAVPGTADNSPLTCRRAYHIFLSDGGWNFRYTDAGLTGTSFKTEMTLPSANSILPIQNFDGKSIAALPAPATASATHQASPYGVQSYSITDPQTQIYRDLIGTRTVSTGSGSSAVNYAYPTLSDISFYYWATDLQPDISNEVIPKIRKTGSETFTSGSKSVTLGEYWNPRNDPAEWQHLVQYTIGYGPTASTLSKVTNTSPQWSGGTFGMYDTGFANLAAGATKWDDVTSSTADNNYDGYRPQELWHMAINSRGKYYPVTGDLTGVFADIFDDIIVDTSAPISGFTSASGSVSRIGTQSYQTSYIAADDPNSYNNRWYGYVTSDSISTTGDATPNPDWGTVNGKNKTTADILDSITTANLANRLILSYNTQGISFEWSNLSSSTTTASQQMWLNKGTVGTGTIAGDGKGSDRLSFIRGDRTKELSNGGSFRNRRSRQGDIVNSGIWYVGAPANGYASSTYTQFASNYRQRLPMVYVGGNDGMLHGFSAKDGTEKIAYIPQGVIQNLNKLTDPLYSHQYYVDGSPFSGDIDLGSASSPNWRTYLAGSLGAGGRGYFVLDVTNPGTVPNPPAGSTAVSNDFIKSNAASLVVMDRTAAAISDAAPPGIPADPNAHPDIGHIFGLPVVAESNQQRALQITKTNDGRWALIMGNGYNSANERPVLLIQYLDGDKSLKTLPAVATGTAEAVGNGLSTPQFLDINADGAPDFVYAGDLRGNLWKFDISSASANQWGVAFNGNPLFTATYTTSTGSSSRQPITAAPVLRPNRTAGGLMVAFGTGQDLTETDRTDRSTQSIYSILDNTRYSIALTGSDQGKVKIDTSNPTPETVNGRSNLVAQSVDTSSMTAGSNASQGRSFWKLSSQQVNYICGDSSTSCSVKKGWYMDLPVSGERVTTSLDFYDGSNILEIISAVPASGSATASGEEVCAPSPQAAQPFRTLIDIATGAPAKPPILDINGDGIYNATDAGYARMTASSKELRFATKGEQIRKGNDGKVDKLNKLPSLLLRPNWRQLK